MKYHVLIYPTNKLWKTFDTWNEAMSEVLFYSAWTINRLFIEEVQ